MTSETLYLIRGDSEDLEVTFQDDAGVALDLTGATVFFTVKKQKGDSEATALIKKDVTLHTDPTNGKTTISITPTDATIDGEFFYDLQIKFPNGKIKSTISGKCVIERDITNRA